MCRRASTPAAPASTRASHPCVSDLMKATSARSIPICATQRSSVTPATGETAGDSARFARLGGHPPPETADDDLLRRRRHGRIGMRERLPVRRAPPGECALARDAPIVIGGEHRRVAQRQHVLEDRCIRLRRARSLPSRLETPAQHLPLPFRTVDPLMKEVALTAALLELAAEAPTARQAGGPTPHEPRNPAHLKAIIAPAMTTSHEGAVATLWKLMFKEDRGTCAVYHGTHRMGLRVESQSGVILSEPFDMQPRVLARTRALRESLLRRGWREG